MISVSAFMSKGRFTSLVDQLRAVARGRGDGHSVLALAWGEVSPRAGAAGFAINLAENIGDRF